MQIPSEPIVPGRDATPETIEAAAALILAGCKLMSNGFRRVRACVSAIDPVATADNPGRCCSTKPAVALCLPALSRKGTEPTLKAGEPHDEAEVDLPLHCTERERETWQVSSKVDSQKKSAMVAGQEEKGKGDVLLFWWESETWTMQRISLTSQASPD